MFIYDRNLIDLKGKIDDPYDVCKIDNERMICPKGSKMEIINVLSGQVETKIFLNDCEMYKVYNMIHNKDYIWFSSERKKLIVMKWSEPEKKSFTRIDYPRERPERINCAEMLNGFLIYANRDNTINVFQY